ncbi:TIR domain-containing protein [Lentzea flava]|uniref:NACHT domain-containing protein n=1 Tax=Lentzea flava TaxID=103732 RepID=A0ABQ2V8V9_9PSEU|nr:TIR domain-containing protein [Lentzea flava]MCP2204024.1 SEFIR domain-containing protein [Lentzea flava]GGU73907.1 hypothetical protein GCM10010178_76690 [Lentzea flava]
MRPQRVFISYAHESDRHSDQVRALWYFLRANGIDARLDRSAASQPQDWALWMAEEIRLADRVLVVASATYRRRAEGRSGPHDGRGVQWEARLIRSAFYAEPHNLGRFVAVVLPGQSTASVPDFLAPATSTVYHVRDFTMTGAEELLRLLTGQPAEPEPALGKIPVFKKLNPLPPAPVAAPLRADPPSGNAVYRTVNAQLRNRRVRTRLCEDLRTSVEFALKSELAPNELAALTHYLESPDFEEIRLQVLLWRLFDHNDENIAAVLRMQIFHGLRHHLDLPERLRNQGALTVLSALVDCAETCVAELLLPVVTTEVATWLSHQAAKSATSNVVLLGDIDGLAEIHGFAQRMRSRVAALHAVMRLPHLRVTGMSAAVAYDDLYVTPTLQGATASVQVGSRSVLLGDPGAGKSTMMAKLAWEIACDSSDRVPFLLVLRNVAASLREGGRGLVAYLEALCREPYNLDPPPNAVEYLLRNGRAVVLLDGVDELVDTDLRDRFARLVESFADEFMSVPIIVTARKVGYETAALNPKQFDVGTIKEFDDHQVATYVRRWFALDVNTSEHDRTALADAFLQHGDTVGELRSNPLLLALLCSMYASEHYLPTNLAQVYEKCALMLFEQWDQMRGVPLPARFEGRLRGAVGYLAWSQLTSCDDMSTSWPRVKIMAVLMKYLEEKGFDHDEAEEHAAAFVDFCTGRPWVLSDGGSNRGKPTYGFTHRTFLEFFAADYLVRSNNNAESLWLAIHARSRDIRWGPVARIALQLYDQKHDDGASEMLQLVTAEDHPLALEFSTDALRHVQPAPGIIRRIVSAELHAAAATDPWSEETWNSRNARLHRSSVEERLSNLISTASPANKSIVCKSIDTLLNEFAAKGLHGRMAQHLLGAMAGKLAPQP